MRNEILASSEFLRQHILKQLEFGFKIYCNIKRQVHTNLHKDPKHLNTDFMALPSPVTQTWACQLNG